jgi:hypothetical protein
MQKLPLDYETPRRSSRPPVRWFVVTVRLMVAVPSAVWGLAMVMGGISAIRTDPAYVAMLLFGLLLIGLAVAAWKLPFHRGTD